MQIVSLGDNLHDKSNPVSWIKQEKIKISSADSYTQHAKRWYGHCFHGYNVYFYKTPQRHHRIPTCTVIVKVTAGVTIRSVLSIKLTSPLCGPRHSERALPVCHWVLHLYCRHDLCCDQVECWSVTQTSRIRSLDPWPAKWWLPYLHVS